MAKTVLDSSAVIALLLREMGAEFVEENIEGALISAVNLAEVMSKLIDQKLAMTDIERVIGSLNLNIVAFDYPQAKTCAELRSVTRHKGLSLGDRACLTIGKLEGAKVLTADKVWAELNLTIDIEVIR